MQSTLITFKSAVVSFRDSVQRVRDVADDVLANTTNALGDPALLRRHDTVIHAVIVMLSGFFEAFLKDVAERYADEIGKKGLIFADLPDRIRYTHFGGGGKVLASVGRKNVPGPYRWVLSTAGDLARRLSSVSNQSYELVWEAFAETHGNPGPEVVKEFLERFGVKQPMLTLAAHIGKSHSFIHNQLESFMAVRNECAHRGMPLVNVSAVDVTAYCDFLEELAEGILSVLSAQRI